MNILREMLVRKGTWWIKSEADTRWADAGETEAASILTMPKEVEQAVARLHALFGEPPADLRWGSMKY